MHHIHYLYLTGGSQHLKAGGIGAYNINEALASVLDVCSMTNTENSQLKYSNSDSRSGSSGPIAASPNPHSVHRAASTQCFLSTHRHPQVDRRSIEGLLAPQEWI